MAPGYWLLIVLWVVFVIIHTYHCSKWNNSVYKLVIILLIWVLLPVGIVLYHCFADEEASKSIKKQHDKSVIKSVHDKNDDTNKTNDNGSIYDIADQIMEENKNVSTSIKKTKKTKK